MDLDVVGRVLEMDTDELEDDEGIVVSCLGYG